MKKSLRVSARSSGSAVIRIYRGTLPLGNIPGDEGQIESRRPLGSWAGAIAIHWHRRRRTQNECPYGTGCHGNGVSLLMYDHFMRLALEEAHAALAEDEVPIGAVIVFEDRVIAAAHNQREQFATPRLTPR